LALWYCWHCLTYWLKKANNILLVKIHNNGRADAEDRAGFSFSCGVIYPPSKTTTQPAARFFNTKKAPTPLQQHSISHKRAAAGCSTQFFPTESFLQVAARFFFPQKRRCRLQHHFFASGKALQAAAAFPCFRMSRCRLQQPVFEKILQAAVILFPFSAIENYGGNTATKSAQF
jgi:hypothetical protein